MGSQLPLTLALIMLVTDIRAQDTDAVAKAYVLQTADIARQVLISELAKHAERVHQISIKFSFQVDARGRPHNVKIVSKTRNPWATETARRALSAATFPPIPNKLAQRYRTDLVNIEGGLDADASR
jgi:hypothetical protein